MIISCNECERELDKKYPRTCYLTEMGFILICETCIEEERKRKESEKKKTS